MKAPLCNGISKYDASVKQENGSLRRLREEGADELDDPDLPVPPAMTIRVTTNIEMSQRAPPFDSSNDTLGARQPGW